MKKIAWTIVICFVILVLGMVACAAPGIRHEITADQSCLNCHGLDGVKPYPQGHAKKALSEDSCTNCHTPQDITE